MEYSPKLNIHLYSELSHYIELENIIWIEYYISYYVCNGLEILKCIMSLGKGSHLCAMNCLWRLLLYSHLEGGSRWCGVGQVVLQWGHAPSDTKVSISWSNLHGIACSVLFFSAMHQCRGSIYDHEYNTLSIGHEFITQNVVSKMAVVHL